MKKQYTKKQIQEAISYWQKQLNQTRPSRLRLDAQFDGGVFGVDELYEIETVSDLGVDPRNCAVQVMFDDDRESYPVFDVEVREHQNFEGDVIVLKLRDGGNSLSYDDFYGAVKKNARGNLAILAEINGSLYPSYAVRLSETNNAFDSFYIIVRRQDRL